MKADLWKPGGDSERFEGEMNLRDSQRAKGTKLSVDLDEVGGLGRRLTLTMTKKETERLLNFLSARML